MCGAMVEFYSLKTESRHDANFLVIGGFTALTLRRQSWHHDNTRFSVLRGYFH